MQGIHAKVGKIIFIHISYRLSLIIGLLNGLWVFDCNTKDWSLLRVPSSRTASYGTKFVESFSNRPGSRFGHAMTLDSSRQVLYVFGGATLGATSAYGISLSALAELSEAKIRFVE